MAGKRKRSAQSEAADPMVHARHMDNDAESNLPPVLSLYYPRVTTLRNFLLESPSLSKSRKKKARSFSLNHDESESKALVISSELDVDQADLVRLLDTTLVGSFVNGKPDCQDYLKDYAVFSRQKRQSPLNVGQVLGPKSQFEVRQFSFWIESKMTDPWFVCENSFAAEIGAILFPRLIILARRLRHLGSISSTASDFL
jgi:hypothetical protein